MSGCDYSNDHAITVMVVMVIVMMMMMMMMIMTTVMTTTTTLITIMTTTTKEEEEDEGHVKTKFKLTFTRKPKIVQCLICVCFYSGFFFRCVSLHRWWRLCYREMKTETDGCTC